MINKLVKIIITYILLFITIKLIIIVQQDFNNLIEIYSDMLEELIKKNSPTLNKCKPPVCNIIDHTWKLNYIERLKQCILNSGGLHNWSSYKILKEIIIDSTKEVCLSPTDPRTCLGSTWFDKLKECGNYSERLFIYYKERSNLLKIYSLEYKVFPFIIPFLDYFGLSNKMLNELLFFISIHNIIRFIYCLIKYHGKSYPLSDTQIKQNEENKLKKQAKGFNDGKSNKKH